MANVEKRFDIAAIIGDENGTVRIMQHDGGSFVLRPRLAIPDAVFDIMDKGKVASVMVSVDFTNSVVRMWDAQEK